MAAFSLDEKKQIVSILGYPRAAVVKGSLVYSALIDSKLDACVGVCDSEVRVTLSAVANLDTLITVAITEGKYSKVEGITKSPMYLSELRSQRYRLRLSLSIDVGLGLTVGAMRTIQ